MTTCRDHTAADPDRKRQDGNREQRAEREHRGHRQRRPDWSGPRLRRVDEEVVCHQDQAGEECKPRVGGCAAAEPDRLGSEQHLGRGDGQPEGRVHHGQRDLREHADLAADAKRRSRLVGEDTRDPDGENLFDYPRRPVETVENSAEPGSGSRGAGPSVIVLDAHHIIDLR